MKTIKSITTGALIAAIAVCVVNIPQAFAEPYVSFDLTKTETKVNTRPTIDPLEGGGTNVRINPQDLQSANSTGGTLAVGYFLTKYTGMEASVNSSEAGAIYSASFIGRLPITGNAALIGKAGASYLEANVVASYSIGVQVGSFRIMAGTSGHGGDVDRINILSLGFVKSF